jgi:hypothetical protein
MTAFLRFQIQVLAPASNRIEVWYQVYGDTPPAKRAMNGEKVVFAFNDLR